MRSSASGISSASPGSVPGHLAPNAVNPIGRFGTDDMELWLHYIKYTSEATSVMFGGKSDLGLSCNYLLHGMLATAAIYLAYLKPEY